MKANLITILSILSALGGSIFAQGNLTPPGAPAPTMKSLDQIEARTPISSLPFTISAQGSYYLTKNLTASGSGAGITIPADNVTVDLNGFALVGGGSGTVAGINVPAVQKNICVRNGTVRGWTSGGIRGDNASNSLFEKLRASDNSGNYGLVAGPGSTVSACIAIANGGGGIATFGHATVLGCTSSANTAKGMSFGSATTVVNCTANGNTDIGIDTADGCTVNDCTSSGNGTYGIRVGANSSLTHCTCSGNPYAGIFASSSCTVADCTASANSGQGIEVDFGSTVRGCTARSNGYAGISVTAGCQVIGNTCDQNSTVCSGCGGIDVYGEANRIDSNNSTYTGNVSGGGYGIWVSGSHNLIIRNSARGNANAYANYFIGPDNRYGPIIDLTASGTARGNGNSAPGTTVSTDPWANFAY